MVRNTTSVAVYWDFENVHLALRDADKSKPAQAGKYGKELALVKIAPVMRYFESLGDVVVHKAFADWRRFSCYQWSCLKHSIDLVQLFPPGRHAKNGADIRLAVEAIDDVSRLSHISRVVILGGDSDFIPLAQKLRQLGKTVIGIAVRESTNEYWPHACSEFRYYRSLLDDNTAGTGNGSVKRQPSDSATSAEKLVAAAVRAARGSSSGDWVTASSVGHELGQIYAGFDSRNFGCRSLVDMLKSCVIVEVRKSGDAVSVRLRESASKTKNGSGHAASQVRLNDEAQAERSVA